MSLEVIKKATEKLENKLKLMVGRCVLNSAQGKGQLGMQVEGLEGETIEGAALQGTYGFASHPPAGSEGVMLSVGGARDNVLVLGMESRGERPELPAGEAKMHSMFGQFIHMNGDGDIVIEAPMNVVIKCLSVKIEAPSGMDLKGGDFTSDAEVCDKTSSMQTMRDQYNPHTHGGPTTDTPME